MQMKKQKEYKNKAIILMMLLVYAFGLIKPTIPLVKDLVAHTFFEASHKATVHYEHGRYHIHLELNEEAKKNDSTKNPVISANDLLATHIKNDPLVLLSILQPVSEINSPYINILTDVNTQKPIIPPEC